MKIAYWQDFSNLVSCCHGLRDAPEVMVFLSLRSVLNRGCKCNKKKKKEQLENIYVNIIKKYKDDQAFIDLISEHIERLNINEIFFLSNDQVLTSIKYE
jgi:protoheme ferro-lyase